MSSVLEFPTNDNFAKVRDDLVGYIIYGVDMSDGEQVEINQNVKFKCVLLDNEINDLGHNLIILYKDNLFSCHSIDFDFL